MLATSLQRSGGTDYQSDLPDQGIKGLRELTKVERLHVQDLAVDQEGRRSRQAEIPSLVFVCLYDRQCRIRLQTLIESCRVQLQACGILFKIWLGIGASILTYPDCKQLVVILPEFALLIRAFSCFCCPVRFTNVALVDDRKISVGKGNFSSVDIGLLDLALRAKCKLSAVRSLEIRIVYESNRSLWITFRSSRGTDATRRWRAPISC